MKNLKFILPLFLFVLFCNIYGNYRELDVPLIYQNSDNWCWAACTEMILEAYGETNSNCSNNNYSQEYIVQYARSLNPNSGVNNLYCGSSIPSQPDFTNELFGSSNSVDVLLADLGYIFGTSWSGNISAPNIKDDIDPPDSRKPIIAGVSQYGDKHMVIIVGYDDGQNQSNPTLYYNDPINGYQIDSYLQFVQTGYDEWIWEESYRMTTDPGGILSYYSPVGGQEVEGIEIISATQEITDPGQKLSYTFRYNDPEYSPEITWNWTLAFYHKDGEVVVASKTETNSIHEYTWNINGFTLPSGYDWVYTPSGKIAGRVKAVIDDGDDDYLHNHNVVSVMFANGEQYPGYVLFQNKTVNQNDLEIKSHYTTEIRNVSFPSNYSNNKVMAGENLILDGTMGDITVEPNTGVSFIVDPALK